MSSSRAFFWSHPVLLRFGPICRRGFSGILANGDAFADFRNIGIDHSIDKALAEFFKRDWFHRVVQIHSIVRSSRMQLVLGW
jgi:hypothetical protein